MTQVDLHPEELFDGLRGGSLPREARARLLSHCEHCAPCRFELRVIEGEHYAQDELNDARAAQLAAAALRQLSWPPAAPAPAASGKQGARWHLQLAAAAALLVLGFGFGAAAMFTAFPALGAAVTRLLGSEPRFPTLRHVQHPQPGGAASASPAAAAGAERNLEEAAAPAARLHPGAGGGEQVSSRYDGSSSQLKAAQQAPNADEDRDGRDATREPAAQTEAVLRGAPPQEGAAAAEVRDEESDYAGEARKAGQARSAAARPAAETQMRPQGAVLSEARAQRDDPANARAGGAQARAPSVRRTARRQLGARSGELAGGAQTGDDSEARAESEESREVRPTSARTRLEAAARRATQPAARHASSDARDASGKARADPDAAVSGVRRAHASRASTAARARGARPATEGDAEAALSLATQARSTGYEGEAVERYRLVIDRFPRTRAAGAAQVALGRLLYTELSQPGAALPLFEAYLARGGAEELAEEALFHRGMCLIALRRMHDASASFRQLLELFPGSMYAAQARAQIARLPAR